MGDLGQNVTFAQPDERLVEYVRPMDAIGISGLHAVVVSPALLRIEMLRKGRTYESC